MDLLSGFVTAPRSKHGDIQRVPINAADFLDLAMQQRLQATHWSVSSAIVQKRADKFFRKAVARAREVLRESGKDANRP